jgi:hypothetical protein
MSDDLPLDPNLRGLLAELVERPERMALGARVRRFQDVLRPDVLRPRTGMGVIETKLLEAHRDELAHLLLQASQVQLANAVLLHPRDRNGDARIVDATHWRRAASGYVKARMTEAEASGPLSLLKRALASCDGEPTPSELAIASLRLVPRTSTTIWVGVHCGIEGNRQRGIEIQKSVLDAMVGGFYGAYAWNNIAWLSTEQGRFHDALEAGKEASMAAPEMSRAAIAWFLSAVQVGSIREATRAATALSDASTGQPGSLTEYVEGLRKTRRAAQWHPTAEARALAQQLHGHVPTEAEPLLEVCG